MTSNLTRSSIPPHTLCLAVVLDSQHQWPTEMLEVSDLRMSSDDRHNGNRVCASGHQSFITLFVLLSVHVNQSTDRGPSGAFGGNSHLQPDDLQPIPSFVAPTGFANNAGAMGYSDSQQSRRMIERARRFEHRHNTFRELNPLLVDVCDVLIILQLMLQHREICLSLGTTTYCTQRNKTITGWWRKNTGQHMLKEGPLDPFL